MRNPREGVINERENLVYYRSMGRDSEVDLFERYGKEPNVRLHGKQKVHPKRLKVKSYFSAVRVLSESFA